jgi:hypothetical protein
VVERVDRHPRLKARFGPWYFAETAMATFLGRYVPRPPRLEVAVGGRTLHGVSLFVQNGSPYTYFKARPVDLVDGAALHSGDLSGALLTRARPTDLPAITFRALSGAARLARHRGVAPIAGFRELTVRSTDGRAVPLQVDGDHVGETVEAAFSVRAGALQVVA